MTTDEAADLWALAFATLKPKASESARQCLNRLVRERIANKALEVNEKTAVIQKDLWPTENLRILKRWHERTNNIDDPRPIVVVQYRDEMLLIDGNNRVNRWLSDSQISEHSVLLITLQ